MMMMIIDGKDERISLLDDISTERNLILEHSISKSHALILLLLREDVF